MGMAKDEIVQRIDLLLSLRRPSEAEQLAREGLSANPDWAAGYSLLALCLLDARPPRVDEALSAARRGLALTPSNGWSHAVLGCALSDAGEEAASEREFREALRQNPGDTFSRSRFGWSLYNRGKVYPALVLASEGLTDAPDDPLLLELIAHAELERSNFDSARHTVSDALAAYPENHAFHYLSGRVSELTATPCQAALPLYEAAVASYSEALRLAPSIEEYRHDLDRAQSALAQIREEFHLLPAAPRSDPHHYRDDNPDPGEDEAAEEDVAAAPEFLTPLGSRDRTEDYELSKPMTIMQWIGSRYYLLFLGGFAVLIALACLIGSLTR